MNEREKAKEQYKSLTPRQKREHIWEYYKIHIIGTIIGLIMVTWLGTDMWNNAHRIILLDISYIGAAINVEEMTNLQLELETYFHEQGIEGEVMVEPLQMGEKVDPNQVMASTAKFMGKAQTNELDLVIMDESYYKQNLESEICDPLDSYVADGSLKASEENLVLENGTALAVDGSKYPAIQKLTYGEEKPMVTIYVNSLHKDRVKEVINYLMEK